MFGDKRFSNKQIYLVISSFWYHFIDYDTGSGFELGFFRAADSNYESKFSSWNLWEKCIMVSQSGHHDQYNWPLVDARFVA